MLSRRNKLCFVEGLWSTKLDLLQQMVAGREHLFCFFLFILLAKRDLYGKYMKCFQKPIAQRPIAQNHFSQTLALFYFYFGNFVSHILHCFTRELG